MKDKIQVFDANVVRLQSKQKVLANMVIEVGAWEIPTMSRVVHIPKGEMKVVNYEPHDHQHKGLSPFTVEKKEIF